MWKRGPLVILVLLAAACQGPGATPTPAPTTTTGTPTAIPPTATPAVTTAPGPLLPGRLLFSRFNELNHSFQASFVSLANGTAEVEVPLPFTEGLARWSRSGTEITVATQIDDGRIGTAIVAPDGTVIRVLAIPDPTLNLACSAWSADDARLACEAWDDTDASRSGIYSVRASDGGGLKRLTTTPDGSTDLPGDYSPDGQLVFKRGTGDEGDGPLLLVDAAGGEPRPIGTGSFEDPGRFSPDGTMVATSTDGRIVVMALDGQGVSRIVEPGAFLFGPAWSPDGTYLAFSSSTSAFRADIWTSLPDGTERQQVTHTSANEINVDWGVDPD